METEIQTLSDTEATPAVLLKLAVSKDLDISKLEKLMELQERWNANQARVSFLEAMSRFQANVPVLEKNKKVAFNEVKYSYAPLGEIAATIKSTMFECGLSHRWEIDDADTLLKCTCIISHKAGHSERTMMSAAKDTSGKKNEIQQRGSSITYLQRYTLIAALGLSTADEDNDGTTSHAREEKKPEQKKPAPPVTQPKKQIKVLNKWTTNEQKETTKEWQSTIEYLMGGRITMKTIEENYFITPDIKKELEAIAKAQKQTV